MNKISCKLKLKCDMFWADLADTSEEGVRHCGNCKENVYLVESQSEFDKCAAEGKCVAIETVEYAMVGVPDGDVFIE